MSQPLVVYSTSWCGPCIRLKRFLDEQGIDYRDVDIETDPEAARFVMRVNHGNRTVPTVTFPDGRTVTNPTPAEVFSFLDTG